MSHPSSNFHRNFAAAALFAVALVPGIGGAQEKLEERYQCFGVAMGAGVAGVLQINITRYSTEEERKLLIDTLKEGGQEKMIDVLRKQKEVGFMRTQTGAGMKGWPSVRIHYANQVQQGDKRIVVLVTDRNVGMAEQMSQPRSVDYDVTGLVLEMQKATGDAKLVEQGQGLLYQAAKLSFDQDGKLKVEYMGTQPIRLTDIKREK
jgi:hypothetical protein